MEERSLKIVGADRNFFNKITNTLTKILIPTKIGINGMLISIKRNILIKAFENYIADNENYDKDELEKKAEKILFTGMIDEFYDYKFGVLEYRSLKFETEILNEENYQGNAVVNYTDRDTPYTRIIEHKHFEYGTQNKTVITKEYPADWKIGDEPYYPINNDRNDEMFAKYKELAVREDKYIFGGRLADYKYYDMHNVIRAALDKVKEAM